MCGITTFWVAAAAVRVDDIARGFEALPKRRGLPRNCTNSWIDVGIGGFRHS